MSLNRRHRSDIVRRRDSSSESGYRDSSTDSVDQSGQGAKGRRRSSFAVRQSQQKYWRSFANATVKKEASKNIVKGSGSITPKPEQKTKTSVSKPAKLKSKGTSEQYVVEYVKGDSVFRAIATPTNGRKLMKPSLIRTYPKSDSKFGGAVRSLVDSGLQNRPSTRSQSARPRSYQLPLRDDSSELLVNFENDKWDDFFQDQTLHMLLLCCDYAGHDDLHRIHNSIRNKLGMRTQRPWPLMPLPKNFLTILSNMSERAYNERNIKARTRLFRIILDLAIRFENNLVPFHNDISLYLALEKHLNAYQSSTGSLSKAESKEYRVLKDMQEWLERTYPAMLHSWTPRSRAVIRNASTYID